MRALVAQGRSVADIALILSQPELTVRRRLKLANVAPRLFALYRDDQISYEQMAALAISDDHLAQQAAWDGLQAWERQPQRLRRLLTEHSLPVSGDRVARYVGLKAYTAAGGQVTRDLFSTGDDGYLEDPALLEGLACAKLERVAKRLAKEGWAWTEVQPRTDTATLAQYARVRTVSRASSPEQAAQLHELAQQAAALEDAANEAKAAESASERSALEQALSDNDLARGRIRATLAQPDPDDRALAGALVTIDEDGKACVLRGLIRPQDQGRMRRSAPQDGQPPTKARPVHSARLTELLSAHCTLGLRAELCAQPEVALRVLAHRLLSMVFYHDARAAGAVQLELRAPALPEAAQAGAAWDSWQAQHAALAAQLPPDGGAALMAWLQEQPRAQVDCCIAYCLSCSVNGQPGQDASVTALAQAVGLDMHKWWQPSAENYFAHVSKARMLEVVTQAASPAAAAALESLPRLAAAAAAARVLDGSAWLPPLLAFEAAQGTGGELEAAGE